MKADYSSRKFGLLSGIQPANIWRRRDPKLFRSPLKHYAPQRVTYEGKLCLKLLYSLKSCLVEKPKLLCL